MTRVPKFVDTKTIIVNLLKEDKKEYLSLSRLQELLSYIYVELWKQGKLCEYQITFHVSFDAIERAAIYNHDIFALDIDGEIIYLRDSEKLDDLVQNYQLDSTLHAIVHDFAA